MVCHLDVAVHVCDIPWIIGAIGSSLQEKRIRRMMGWHPPSLRFRKEYSGSRDILQMSRNNSPSYGVSKAKVLQAPPFSIMQHDPCAETGKQLCSVSLVEHERNSALHYWGIVKRSRHRTLTPASPVRIRLPLPLCACDGIGRHGRFKISW